MSPLGIGQDFMRRIAGEVTGRTVSGSAGQAAARTFGKDGLAGLDRSAVDQIARFNAPIARKAPQLLKMKYQEMATDPFAFYRGSDSLYTSDFKTLFGDRALGKPLLLADDEHMDNFGTYTRANGQVAFGLNDFDEASTGPAKVDIYRYGTSVVLAANQQGMKADAPNLVGAFADAYHKELAGLARGERPPLEQPDMVKKLLSQANGTSTKTWIDKLAPKVKGQRMFARSATTTSVDKQTYSDVASAVDRYRASLPAAQQNMLGPYEVKDVASVTAGVGSVGRARYRALLTAKGRDPVVLEIKEEVPPAWKPQTPGVFSQQASRDVLADDVMDTHADPFQGKTTLPTRDALESNSFLVRRVYPSKAAIDLTTLHNSNQMQQLVQYEGRELARAHASGVAYGLADAHDLLAQIGDRTGFTRDVQTFSQRYAKQVASDHQSFVSALRKDGTLKS